jgi:hypothetical protein
MKKILLLPLAALGLVAFAPQPAQAHGVDISVGVGGPYYYDTGYYGYDGPYYYGYYRPWYWRHHHHYYYHRYGYYHRWHRWHDWDRD